MKNSFGWNDYDMSVQYVAMVTQQKRTIWLLENNQSCSIYFKGIFIKMIIYGYGSVVKWYILRNI